MSIENVRCLAEFLEADFLELLRLSKPELVKLYEIGGYAPAALIKTSDLIKISYEESLILEKFIQVLRGKDMAMAGSLGRIIEAVYEQQKDRLKIIKKSPPRGL